MPGLWNIDGPKARLADISLTPKSVLVPSDSLTLTQMSALRKAAMQAGVQALMDKNSGMTPDMCEVRAFENIRDVAAALDQWNTAALAVVGTAYNVFQAVAAPAITNDKVLVFYKVQYSSIPFAVSLLTFRTTGAAGNMLAQFDMEQIEGHTPQEGYFSKPVVFDTVTPFWVSVTARQATAALARVQLGAYVVTTRGQTITG